MLDLSPQTDHLVAKLDAAVAPHMDRKSRIPRCIEGRPDMRRIRHRFAAWAMVFLVIPASAPAAEEMVLSKVMKEQGKSMQLIAGGIAREDYEQVAKASLAVIDPPHPPSTLAEKFRLMSFLGTNVGRFKALDGETKERATDLANAARARNGEATIAAFQRLQTSCLACHTEFRKPFQDHFKP